MVKTRMGRLMSEGRVATMKSRGKRTSRRRKKLMPMRIVENLYLW